MSDDLPCLDCSEPTAARARKEYLDRIMAARARGERMAAIDVLPPSCCIRRARLDAEGTAA
jgi:hypothetical protein